MICSEYKSELYAQSRSLQDHCSILSSSFLSPPPINMAWEVQRADHLPRTFPFIYIGHPRKTEDFFFKCRRKLIQLHFWSPDNLSSCHHHPFPPHPLNPQHGKPCSRDSSLGRHAWKSHVEGEVGPAWQPWRNTSYHTLIGTCWGSGGPKTGDLACRNHWPMVHGARNRSTVHTHSHREQVSPEHSPT